MAKIDSYSGIKTTALELNENIDKGLDLIVKQTMDWDTVANMSSDNIAGYKMLHDLVKNFKELNEAYAKEMNDFRKALRDIQDDLEELKKTE